MAQYSLERKQAILDKLLSPTLISIAQLARDEHIAEQTLYNWRNRAKQQGKAVPTNHKTQELSPETKLTIIIDTAKLNETELAEYCRSKGLYPEQIAQWKTQTLTGFSTSEQQTSLNRKQHQTDQKQIKQLKQEIKRKDKALAEAAAILILRKKLNALWGGRRGRMTSLSERQQLITLIGEATDKGARLHIACSEVGISRRTYRRWKADKDNTGDKRPIAVRPAPSNKLSDIERQAILDACNEPRFASLPPSQIVPTLLDEGIYHASESSFYRVLRQHNQLTHRGRAKAPNPRKPPETFIATKPCQVFCWDITYLPSTVRGQFYYLYMIEDVYSRKIVGFEVYDREAGDLAAKLLERTLLNEKAIGRGVILHSDNGAPMKSQTLRMKAYELGVLTSYSRPRVSNDNPFAEALFRTVKYAPSFPEYGFDSLEIARVWVNDFVSWYNNEHKHSGLNFVTPNERHTLKDAQVLAQREEVLLKAKGANPARWNGRAVRDCSPVEPTALNPVRLSRRVKPSEVLVA